MTAGERSFLVVGAMSSLYDRAGITVHEQTPHRIAPPDSLRAAPERAIDREDIRPDGRAFVLRHVLSPSECAHFIAAAEALGMRDTGVEHKVRRADRVVAFGEDVAALLYARCREHFAPLPPPPPPSGKARARGGGAPRLQWRPDGLNPCFRVCRYDAGGHFMPHFDDCFQESATRRSHLTFMLYLNSGFEGGATSFYDARQRPYRAPNHDFAYYSYTPEAGSCVVFDHNLLHDGGVLRGTTPKYIMRSEVMFRRGAVEEPPRARVDAPPRAAGLPPEVAAGVRAAQEVERASLSAGEAASAATSTAGPPAESLYQ